MDERKIIRPQEGFQEDFLSCPADIAIGGGAAGAGKTFALLIEAIRNKDVSGYNGVIFRRTTPQIRNSGGLWDTSSEVYSLIGGKPTETTLEWNFKGKSTIKFIHLEHENDKYNHQGGQYAFIGFDELTHFTKTQFFYLLSRNRSMSGVKPYIRATCNPDPDSWVADFISWWIDPVSGFPIPERSGKLRYFVKDGNVIVWGDTPDEVIQKCPHIYNQPELQNIDPRNLVKSVSFIPGSIYENKELMRTDPAYLGNLLSLDESEQLKLLKGNWKIRQDGTALFMYQKINDLFTNFVDDSPNRYITCDAARFGDNLAVIISWEGMAAKRIEVFTKSKTTDITAAIEAERQRFKVSKSNVVVDQDGVGGGVVDEGGYQGFSGGSPAVVDPNTNIKEFYKNLKTQCYYRFAEQVNLGNVSIDDENCIVDGREVSEIKIGQELVPVRKLIIDDLRSIKKKNEDSDGKKQINSKDEQKNILGGRSPDFSDSLSLRVWFDIVKTPEPSIRML